MHDIWVFGYGSLMWRPGFAFLEAHPAVLAGRKRALCVYSVVHRGTPERPGLVFGLDPGGSCTGMAYRVAAADVTQVLEYLRAREQVTGVYQERWLPVSLAGGAPHASVRAVCYVADPCHRQYAGCLDLAEQAHIVSTSSGRGGPNVDYVLSTSAHLQDLGIRDRALERLVGLVGRRPSHGPGRQRIFGSLNAMAARVEMHDTRPRPTPRFAGEWQLRVNHRRNIGL